jgi:methionine-rich copper-binding protein CopC
MHRNNRLFDLLNPIRFMLATTVALMCLGTSPLLFAQHVMDPNASSSNVEMESSPTNDEILSQSPRDFMLRFSTYVRLVKLSVKGPDDKLVNVDFRYQTDASRVFFWDIPTLPDADYYTVEWAAIDPRNLIARGTFSFSFGPNARPASELIPEVEVLEHIVTPDYRIPDQ